MFGNTYRNLFAFVLTEREQILDPVYCGSRERALREGDLISVDERTAMECGFQWPVAITRAVYDRLIKETAETGTLVEHLESARLVLILNAVSEYIERENPRDSDLRIAVFDERFRRETILEVRAHGGDNDEPVLTLRIVDSQGRMPVGEA